MTHHRSCCRTKSEIEKVPADEQMRLLVDSVTDYAIYLLDPTGTVVTWNPGAERLKGYSADQIIGKNFTLFFTDEDVRRGHPEYVLDFAKCHDRYEEEAWRVRKDGTTFFANIVITSLKRKDGTVLGYAKVTRDITSRLQYEVDSNASHRLQQALLPAIPPIVPGLTLDLFYESSLKECQVGGDFYDVFPVNDGCTAIVVGDISGKGLSAAVEVATIKNMLRFAVYNNGSLSGAVDMLNTTLVKHRLLQGFATLFVGLYYDSEQQLDYINCGQEPPLILRRASGQIDELYSSCTIVGAFADTHFEHESVRIRPDDIIAIFTDGLTEAGNRQDGMFGLNGIKRVLLSQENGAKASSAIVAEVKNQTGRHIQDDMCLLVAQCVEKRNPVIRQNVFSTDASATASFVFAAGSVPRIEPSY